MVVAEHPLELGELRLDPGADALTEVEDLRIGDPIERAGPLFPTGDESSRQQGGQEVDDPQPGRVGEGAEAICDQLRGLRRYLGVEGAYDR